MLLSVCIDLELQAGLQTGLQAGPAARRAAGEPVQAYRAQVLVWLPWFPVTLSATCPFLVLMHVFGSPFFS